MEFLNYQKIPKHQAYLGLPPGASATNPPPWWGWWLQLLLRLLALSAFIGTLSLLAYLYSSLLDAQEQYHIITGEYTQAVTARDSLDEVLGTTELKLHDSQQITDSLLRSNDKLHRENIHLAAKSKALEVHHESLKERYAQLTEDSVRTHQKLISARKDHAQAQGQLLDSLTRLQQQLAKLSVQRCPATPPQDHEVQQASSSFLAAIPEKFRHWSLRDLQVFFALVFGSSILAFGWAMWRLRREQRSQFRPGSRR